MRLINNVKHSGWWVCAICGRHRHVAGGSGDSLNWQNLNVSLRCERCYDNPRHVLYSQRMAEIARVLQVAPRYGEPELEPKLAQPDYGSISEG